MKGRTLAQKESPPWRTRTTLTLHHPKRRLGRQRMGCTHVTCVTRYFRRAAHCWDTNMSTQVCPWTQAQGSKSACDLLHRKNTEATSDVFRILQEVVYRPLFHSYINTAFSLCVFIIFSSSSAVFTVWGQWAEVTGREPNFRKQMFEEHHPSWLKAHLQLTSTFLKWKTFSVLDKTSA